MDVGFPDVARLRLLRSPSHPSFPPAIASFCGSGNDGVSAGVSVRTSGVPLAEVEVDVELGAMVGDEIGTEAGVKVGDETGDLVSS